MSLTVRLDWRLLMEVNTAGSQIVLKRMLQCDHNLRVWNTRTRVKMVHEVVPEGTNGKLWIKKDRIECVNYRSPSETERATSQLRN